MRHPLLPLSTTPCADQPAITTWSLRDWIATDTDTNLSYLIVFESEEGTPTFGNAGLSSATPRRGGGDRAGKPVISQPEGDRGQASLTQSPRLEKHGCRPRSPGPHSTSWGSSGASGECSRLAPFIQQVCLDFLGEPELRAGYAVPHVNRGRGEASLKMLRGPKGHF